jgi:site-specific DNA recombinase
MVCGSRAASGLHRRGRPDGSSIYLRVSTEEQRERQSIETQRELAERYCALHSLAIHRIYADEGLSGAVPVALRPETRRFIEDVRLHRFDQLLVYKLDRLGRDARLILNAVDELGGDGVRVRSMTEEFDANTAPGKLMLTMLSGFAAHEREVIRERSVAGTNRVAESGSLDGWNRSVRLSQAGREQGRAPSDLGRACARTGYV